MAGKNIVTITLLCFVPTSMCGPTKINSRPVHEIINEQSRIDDNMRPPDNPAVLPYGNPLAGNSKQARIYAQNQQAMFQAERMRQHRAQLQRWTKAPQQADSYMRAYHESQENHHLALEQQQAILKDIHMTIKTTTKSIRPVTKAPPKVRPSQKPRPELKRGPKVVHNVEATKITIQDAIKPNNRNHRSYGSHDYQQLQDKKYQTVYLSPGPTYDQGVTIKPHGNVGLTHLKSIPEEIKLYTEADPSKTQYVYPKHYHQMLNYKSAQDIDTLNSLLKKPATEQLSEFSALLKSGNQEEPQRSNLNTPIDLFFYLKDSPVRTLPEHYEQSSYADITPTYASAYMPQPIKDHTPIIEEIDDVEDPNKNKILKTYGLQAILATQAPQESIDTTTMTNNYYKVKDTSHASYEHKIPYSEPEVKSTYQALHTLQPLDFYVKKGHKTEVDSSERYLHHNAQPTVIQHLNEDGTGVSAYGDDNVSISNVDAKTYNKTRITRSALDTNPFVVSSAEPLTESPILNANSTNVLSNDNNTDIKAEALNYNPYNKRGISTFLTTPKFPKGVAKDYNNYDYDNYQPLSLNRPNNNEKYQFYEDDEDSSEYDDEFDSEYLDQTLPTLYSVRPTNYFKNYAPNSAYNQNVDLKGSFSKQHRHFYSQPTIPTFPQIYPSYGSPTPFAPPIHYHTPHNFAEPTYEPFKVRKHNFPINNNPDLIEPVYMLTQSQLKSLIGDQNINIQHYDVFQLPKHKPKHYRRKPSKHYGHRKRNFKKNLTKLHKLHLL